MASSPEAIVEERLRARGGRIELLGEHLARLFADEPGGAASTKAAQLESALLRAFEKAGRRDGVVELMRLDRGEAVFTFTDPEFDGEQLAQGLHLRMAGERPPLDAVKGGARLLRARELLAQATQTAAEEFLWTTGGALVGATAMNLFLVRGAALVTPSLASGAWPGIGRRAVLAAAHDLAPELGLAVREEKVGLADLALADDAFLACSAHGIVAIAALDGRPLPAPPRGSPARALVPRLRLRYHELCNDRFLPPG